MEEKNRISRKYRRMVSALMIIMLCLLTACFCACINQDEAKNQTGTENEVRAADPMTEEEMEADDSDGCIEDSEDLLY